MLRIGKSLTGARVPLRRTGVTTGTGEEVPDSRDVTVVAERNDSCHAS